MSPEKLVEDLAKQIDRRSFLRTVGVSVAGTVLGLLGLPATAAAVSGSGLTTAFHQAAQEFGVPRDLLVTLAYAETHFDDHAGQPSLDHGYGLMHLVHNPLTNTLGQAATLLGTPAAVLQTDMRQNIRGGAALLRTYANQLGLTDLTRQDLAAWEPVLARYSNATDAAVAHLYADTVYDLLQHGLSGQTQDGETIVVPASVITLPQRSNGSALQALGERGTRPDAYAPSPDAPGATTQADTSSTITWAPASSRNYQKANRPKKYRITHVIMHTTQGSYTSAINWFQNPASEVSAHYVIRSRDGQIFQTVSERNIAYHAGNEYYNEHSIGIEHEGFVSNPAWYTDAMYRSSAALTRSICLRYGIPMDRAHIIGHTEVPGAQRTDPGRYWNWTYYMQLVQGAR